MELSYDIFHIVTSYLDETDVIALSSVCSTYYSYTDNSRYGKFGNIRLDNEMNMLAKRISKCYKAPLLVSNINRMQLVLAAHSYNPCSTLVITNSCVTWENHLSVFDAVDIEVKPLTNRLDISLYDRIVIDNAHALGYKHSKLIKQLANKSVWALYNHAKGGISLFRSVFGGTIHMSTGYIQLRYKLHILNYDALILDTIGRSYYESIVVSRKPGIEYLCSQYPHVKDCLVGSVISRKLLYAKILSLISLPDTPYIVINDTINRHSVDQLELGIAPHAYITSIDQMKLTTVRDIYLFVGHLASQIHYYMLARHTNIYLLTTRLTVTD